MDSSKVVVLRSFVTGGEASIYKALLESSGVECALINENSSGVLPIGSNLMQINLIVEEDQLERAEEVLSAKFDVEEFDKESAKRHKKP